MKPVLGLAGFGALWEMLPRLGLVPAQWVPPLSRVLRALGTQALGRRFWEAVGNTLLTWALGLVVAVIAGVVIGVLIGAVPVLRALTASTIEFLRPIPSVALILAVTGELVIGSPGLGKLIYDAQFGDDVPQMYALVLATGLIGVTANVITRLVERKVLAWHPSVRREVPA